ncbi:TPA: GtrA family protein [Candidatus Galligastranaerophilus intestinavium]|uniref:GtrA family protein n=1 Tax=Candidatus Galligastranaerophilus intestinavium TaxID=2840836 RepID=A0A9D1JXR2_9BACT|nr:GtrA family protein [Candidatus Galligastranaerophilus intestinavium]
MKFLFVGALNTAFGYSVYALFVTLHASHNIALTIQYILGVLWNFKTTGVIVFKNHDNSRIIRFFMSYVITYSINLVCLNFLVHFGLGKYISQAVMVLPMAVLSFLIFKTFVFKEKNKGLNNVDNAL